MPDTVLVAGETLVDFLPDSADPLSTVDGFRRRPGGAPANVAVRLAQLGRDPLFWTRVGADPFGEFLVETLDSRGVDRRFVQRDPDAKTALAFVTYGEAGDPTFSFYRDGTADTRLQRGQVPDAALESVEWVVVGGVVLASEPSRSAIFDLAERAQAADCRVVFDPNARPELWTDADFGRQVRRMLDRTDVVVATPADLREAGFEGSHEALAVAVIEAGPSTAVLTLAEDGAYGRATAEPPWGPAESTHGGYDVEAVDTTGAGDAFTAGMVDAFARGESLADVLAHANAVAAASTTDRGGMGTLPDPSTVR